LNILKVLSTWFLWWIFTISWYYFSKKNYLFLFWYFQQPSHLSLSLTQQIYCDIFRPWQKKYNDHNVRCNGICHSYPLHPIFLKHQLKFQTSYMNLKSIHISILKIIILNRNFLLWFWIFLFQHANSYLNSEKLYINLKNWFSIM